MILAAEMGRRTPGRLLLDRISINPRHHINAPADIGHVGRVVRAAGELVPGAGTGVVNIVRARQDREATDIANNRAVTGLGVGTNVAPPGEHGAGAGQELLEAGGAGIGIELVGGFRRQRVDHVLDGAHPGRIVDARLHRIDIEQPGLVVGVLGIGGGARIKEVEAEAAPALDRIEIAIGILAAKFLAFEELGDFLNLLPGLWNAQSPSWPSAFQAAARSASAK